MFLLTLFILMYVILTNSVDPAEMPHNAAFHLDLHCHAFHLGLHCYGAFHLGLHCYAENEKG